MKSFLSIILTVSGFLTGVLLVLLLTVFQPSFLENQMQGGSSISDEWASKIATSVSNALPVPMSSSNRHELQDAISPVTDDIQSKIIECIYDTDKFDQVESEITSSISTAVYNSVQKMGFPQVSGLSSNIHSYVSSSVKKYFESGQIKQLKELSQKLNSYKKPTVICSIIFGILSLVCWIALLALKSKGSWIAPLIVSALLAAGSILLQVIPISFSYDFLSSYQKALASSLLIPAGCAFLLTVISFIITFLLGKKSRRV